MNAESDKYHDYLAELHVAGLLADAGWNVYFPHRDEGFDFIITRVDEAGNVIIRPVQVKGKYPTEEKGDKTWYGYIGKLTITHPEMILVIAFFDVGSRSPAHVAFIPWSLIRTHTRGYRCQPAKFVSGKCQPREWYSKFFDSRGIVALPDLHWGESTVGAAIRGDRFTSKPGDFKIVGFGEES
ncbi:MAG: hypothetical protein ABSD96_17295 [Candidatus Korobacteraceae bacterium]|jgi:hypothetical protein